MTPTLRLLIRGSLAIDTILAHQGFFSDSILPEALSKLNVSFPISTSREEFGGTAGNIAHNCRLLGDAPLVNASVGALDGGAWEQRLQSWGLELSALRQVPGLPGARAYIMGDGRGCQISGFAPGAIAMAPDLPDGGFDCALLASDSAESMARSANELTRRSVPYLFDPGQALPLLAQSPWRDQLPGWIENAACLFVNDYEAELCEAALERPFDDIARGLPACVRTLGAQGCELWIHGADPVAIPACSPLEVVDPTGCGDAFRAGFSHGLCRGWDLKACAQLGSAMSSFAIEKVGGQAHAPSMESIQARFELSFGSWPTPLGTDPLGLRRDARAPKRPALG
jgi:adenosine kinase